MVHFKGPQQPKTLVALNPCTPGPVPGRSLYPSMRNSALSLLLTNIDQYEITAGMDHTHTPVMLYICLFVQPVIEMYQSRKP